MLWQELLAEQDLQAPLFVVLTHAVVVDSIFVTMPSSVAIMVSSSGSNAFYVLK